MYKTSYSFDLLINAPYFIQLKKDPSRYKKDPFPVVTTRAILGVYRGYDLAEVMYMKIGVWPDWPYLCTENIYSGLMI